MDQRTDENLTPEEHARRDAAEQHALNILKGKINEGRRYPRRHQLFLLTWGIQLSLWSKLIILAALALLVVFAVRQG